MLSVAGVLLSISCKLEYVYDGGKVFDLVTHLLVFTVLLRVFTPDT
jgi:hypothetical protein